MSSRVSALRRLILVALGLALAGIGPARAANALLSLGDGCLDPGTARVELPLYLTGAGDRLLALRTTVLFDPARLAPEAEPVLIGDALRHRGLVHLGADVTVPGRLDIVVQRDGAWPLPALPEGMLVRLRFRALGEVWSEAGTVVQLDRSGTRGTSEGDAPSAPEIAGPVGVHLPADEPALVVTEGTAGTRLEPQGGGRSFVVRGRLEDLRPMGDRVLIPSVEPLGEAAPGRPLVDPDSPPDRQAFYYLTATPTPEGGTALGFASDCRPRMLATRGF